MKKTVTRAALLLLVLALTVSMAACKKKDAVKNDTLTGKWAVSNDLSELLASDSRKVKPEQAELLKDMDMMPSGKQRSPVTITRSGWVFSISL